jgi:ketosteroid isomerase-like protein
MTPSAVLMQQWHEAVARNDIRLVEALLADDAVFMSPAVHTPQQGKAQVLQYLGAAMRVLNTEHFKYVGEWRSERSAVLEFETDIGGVYVNGVDMIHWNEAGQITVFKVMLRPLKALNTMVALMMEQFKKPGG